MNKKLIIGILSAIVLIILCTVAWFLIFTPAQQSPASSLNSTVNLPSSGSISIPVPGSTTSSNSTRTMAVSALGGGSVVTNDFIHNGVTLLDAVNKGRYLLAGNLGRCLSDTQKCQAGTAIDFNIFYDNTDGSFTIALLKEPLGQARLEVEQFLLKTLGISQGEMCKLNYYLGTTSDINTLYDSKNLGFSFCPGATILPK